MSSDVRELDGFISRGGEVPHVDPNDVLIVGLDTPETTENWYAHCARLKDESDADLEEYVVDILRTGRVDDPIDACRDGDKLIVLDGRRSTRAARIAWSRQKEIGIKKDERVTIRVLLRRGEPEELFRYNADSHKKKPLTATQRARLYLNYHERTGEDLERTRLFFGVTSQTVRNMLAIFDLDAQVQKKLDTGEIPLREAVKLRTMPRADQREALAQLVAVGATQGVAASAGIAQAKRGEKVEKIEKTRMRSRAFLVKWKNALSKNGAAENHKPLLGLLHFILGGPLPEEVAGDEHVLTALDEAGFRRKKERRGKKKKEAKPEEDADRESGKPRTKRANLDWLDD